MERVKGPDRPLERKSGLEFMASLMSSFLCYSSSAKGKFEGNSVSPVFAGESLSVCRGVGESGQLVVSEPHTVISFLLHNHVGADS